MGLTRLAILRPVAILTLIVTLVMLGGVAYSRLRQDRFPSISFPAVFVRYQYPQSSPSDVEELVAKPVEDALSGLSGLDTITSTSGQGQASINIRFVEGTDVDQATLDVERRLASIRSKLPTDVTDPNINKADTDAFPIMNIAVGGSGQHSLADIYQMAVSSIQPALEAVPGVASVDIQGGLVRELQVKIAPERLNAYGVSYQTIVDTLGRENVNLPGGSMISGTLSEDIRAVGQFQSASDVENVLIPIPGGGTVPLKELATVVDGYADQTRIQRFNGQDAVGLVITKQSDANGVQVADGISAALDALSTTLPSDIQFQITSDASSFTRKSIGAVQSDLILAIALTGIVLALFLHTWRNTLIVLLAIPTCLVITCLVMFFAGFTLNVITLLALALTVGILVDDSIVVLENINRHLEEGEPAPSAALKGRSEIGLAAIAITLVDVVVFLPVSFMSGNIGQLFRQFGVTIAATTLISLFMSFTLTPMLASRWLRPPDGTQHGWQERFGEWWENHYQALARRYRRALAVGLRFRFLVFGLSFACLIGALSLVFTNRIGSEFAPTEDDGLFQVSMTMPAGTALAGTDATARRVEQILRAIPDVQDVFTSVGSGGLGSGGSTQATIAVQLIDFHQRSHSVADVIAEMRRQVRGIPDAQIRASVQNPLAGGGGPPVDVQILGNDQAVLEQLATRVQALVNATPGAVDAQNNSAQRNPEIDAVLDRQRLADLHLNASAAAQALRTSMSGAVVTQLRPPGADPIDIRVMASDEARTDTKNVGALPLLGQGDAVIRLDQVATVTEGAGPAQIRRANRRGVVDVTANVIGRSPGDVARDVRGAMADMAMPDGYTWRFSGQVQQQETAFGTLLGTLVLSVLLVYLLMAALFESWLTPLAIMFSLPVALVGALLGLFVTGNTFSVFSLIAMIMLMGLVGKNAILLVDMTNRLRAEGMARTEAILTAGEARLRPIVMTSSTVIFAMFPLALKFEPGNETRAPIAVVLIGGVLSSTLLTLLLVPGVYTMLDDLHARVVGSRGRKLTRAEIETAPMPSRDGRLPVATSVSSGH